MAKSVRRSRRAFHSDLRAPGKRSGPRRDPGLVAQRALITLAEAATAGLTPAQMLDLVVAAAGALVGGAIVHLWLVEDERRELRLVAESGTRPGRPGAPFRARLKLDEGLAGVIATRREPLVVPSMRGERRLANPEWVRDQGVVSFAGVPFARAGRLLGVLCVLTRRRHHFTRQEVDLLRSFASHAAVALESAALLDTAGSRLRRLETLREIEREISQQHDPDELLGLIVQRATELLEADSATVFLLDEQHELLRPHASFNAHPRHREVALQPGEGVVGTIAVRREGMIVNDYSRSPYAIPPFRELDAAVVGQPLLHGESLRGVILVRREKAHRRTFSDADLVHLGDFAVQASIALENARLFRLASARAERVKAAAEVGRLLVSTLDAARILDVIAEKCRDTLGVGAFGLFRFGADGRFHYVRGFGLDEAFMRSHTLGPGEGVVGRAVVERRTIETADVLRDPGIQLSDEARARIEQVGSRAIVAVPILIRAEVLGVVAVYHPPGFRIPAEEREFLETLANHTAAALDNARQFGETRRRQEIAETLAALTQTLTGSLDLPTVLSLVADGVRRLLGSDGGAIGLTEPDGAIRLSVAVGLGAGAFRDSIIRPGQGVGGRVLERGEPFWTTDYLNDPRLTTDFTERVRATGIVGELAVPVRLREQTVGVLWALYGRPQPITDDDVGLATDLAHVVAIALENARLYQESRQREAEARAVFEMGRLISATLDAERVLDLIVERVMGLLGVPACGLFRLGDDGELRYVRGTGLTPEFIAALRITRGEGTSGRSVAERVPVWTADILADPAVTLSPAARALVEKEGYRAVLSVPISIMDTPYGCLATYWWEPHQPTPGEIGTLSSLATFAAVALENARLYGEAREYVARLTRLNEVNRDVSASLRLDEVLTKVAQAAGSFFGAPVATLWVADDERRLLTRRAGHGDPELLGRIPTRLAFGEGGAGWIAENRRPLFDLSLEADDRVTARDAALARGVTSFSGVPIVLGERLLGVMTLGGRQERRFSTADLALLQTLMGQAAIAIEHARLYEEAQRQEAEAVALAEASRRFSASLRREAVFDLLVETASRMLGGSWAVLLVRPEPPRLRPIATAQRDPDERTRWAPTWKAVAEGPALGVVATETPLLLREIDDLPADSAARAELERWGVRSLLVVPIVTGGAVRAIFTGLTSDDSPQFTERDLRLAQAVADRAAIALENARLFEELTRAYQDLKTAQEHLVQTEKLRALGEMASGVAHDFNNILAAILGRVQLILSQVEEPTLRRWLQVIERAALDGAQTVRQIQEFTRIRRDQPVEQVDLNQVVRDSVEMSQTRWRDQTQSQGLEVRMLVDLAPIPAVEGHPAELRQVLTNLILNAVDALPQGGKIAITTRPASGGVDVTVADTGVGMSDEVRRRIFEPFFSTKGPGGTGLGLAMVYGIVSRHSGQVFVASKEGEGATFTIHLPAADRGAPGDAASRVAPAADATIRVLVIDDEEPVREALADMLRLKHHYVVVAREGAEGLARFREGPFDLVMTDLAMPGMSGWQVAQAVKTLSPEVSVVLVTGWGVELPPDQLHANGVDRVMTKPFKIEDVQEVVASFRSRRARGGTGNE